MTTQDYLPLNHGMIPPPGETGAEFWFVVRDQAILISLNSPIPLVPPLCDIATLQPHLQHPRYIGALRGIPCRAAPLSDTVALPEGFGFRDLRTLLGSIDEELFLMAGRASATGGDRHLRSTRSAPPLPDHRMMPAICPNLASPFLGTVVNIAHFQKLDAIWQ